MAGPLEEGEDFRSLRNYRGLGAGKCLDPRDRAWVRNSLRDGVEAAVSAAGDGESGVGSFQYARAIVGWVVRESLQLISRLCNYCLAVRRAARGGAHKGAPELRRRFAQN